MNLSPGSEVKFGKTKIQVHVCLARKWKIKRSIATNKTCDKKKDDDLPVQDHLH